MQLCVAFYSFKSRPDLMGILTIQLTIRKWPDQAKD